MKQSFDKMLEKEKSVAQSRRASYALLVIQAKSLNQEEQVTRYSLTVTRYPNRVAQ